jgi:hypothetical protein
MKRVSIALLIIGFVVVLVGRLNEDSGPLMWLGLALIVTSGLVELIRMGGNPGVRPVGGTEGHMTGGKAYTEAGYSKMQGESR